MSSAAEILKKYKERQLEISKRGQLPQAAEQDISAISLRGAQHARSDAPPWIYMYGDMMSLLLVFFILLFAMSTVNKAQFKAAMESVNTAIQGKKPGREDQFEKTVEDVYRELEDMILKEKLSKVLELGRNPHGIVISMGDQILFSQGNADLTRAAKLILQRLSKILGGVNYAIEVSGHTDNIPIRAGQYPTNWELSSARACSVVKFLVTFGQLAPQRLVAKGFAEFAPKVPNISKANRAKNRRIEILILRS